MTQPHDNNEPKEERKLEPYHYEAMIRAEVEKRLAAEKKPEPAVQPIYPPAHYESPPPYLAQQSQPGFPMPSQQTGQYPMQQTGHYYSGQAQPQQYQSGPLPYPQQYPQPQPYYQQPPAAPVINVVVNTNNVNQNVNTNYNRNGYRYTRHGSIGFANIVYFLLIGWCLGLTWAIVAIFATILNSDLGNTMMRQAFFLAFLI